MIPSDHFVMFYNEIFKFLVRQGPDARERYYERVAARQGNFALDQYRREGLKGLYDYYCRIRKEENCDLDLNFDGDSLCLRMNRCPSLAKALESDAGACPVYCDHCPGWCMRVTARAGIWEVYDMISRTKPVCDEWYFTDATKCRRKYEELVAVRGPDLVRTNLDAPQPYLTNRISESKRFEFLNPHFAKAFRFLRETDLTKLPNGRIMIDGDNVFVNVMSAKLSPFKAEDDYEVHRRYIDIQVPINGEETFGAYTLSDLSTAGAYDVAHDISIFKAKGEPITLCPGEFIAFFPSSGAHCPGCTRAETVPADFRKLCVKVKFEN